MELRRAGVAANQPYRFAPFVFYGVRMKVEIELHGEDADRLVALTLKALLKDIDFWKPKNNRDEIGKRFYKELKKSLQFLLTEYYDEDL